MVQVLIAPFFFELLFLQEIYNFSRHLRQKLFSFKLIALNKYSTLHLFCFNRLSLPLSYKRYSRW